MEMNKIKDVAGSNPTSRGIFSNLADRQRIRRYTDLDRFRVNLLQKGVKLIDDDYFDTFSKLEDMGLGKIQYGIKNKPNKFIWYYSLIDVAKVGLDKSVSEPGKIREEHAPVVVKKERRVLRTASKALDTPKKMLFISLREGVDIEISIPEDIQRPEVDAICSAIKRAVRAA